MSDSTAPIAVKCQSFLDNFIAHFGAFEHEMIELGQRLQSLRRRGFGTLAAPVLEEHLDPESLFKFANLFALAGWVALVTGIVTNRPWLRDRLARMYWPLAISAGYTLAIAAGWS